MKFWIYIITGTIAGGIVGWSGILCYASHSCAMTGTWYGGALMGFAIGWIFSAFSPSSQMPAKTNENAPHTPDAE